MLIALLTKLRDRVAARRDVRFHLTLVNFLDGSNLTANRVGIEFSKPCQATGGDIEICERLIAAFHQPNSDTELHNRPSGLWTTVSRFHQELADALAARNSKALAELLGRVFISRVTNGPAMGEVEYKYARSGRTFTYSLLWKDRVVSLANAIGALAYFNPESEPLSSGLALDCYDLLARIEARLSIHLSFPQVGGVFGVKYHEQIIPMNFLYHVCTAHKLASLANSPKWSCLEIGGGIGGLAYASALFGVDRYTIIDLPLVNVIQGYFLLKSQFAPRVRLFGERKDLGSVQVLPASSISEIAPYAFDLVINQDSLPEIGKQAAIQYLHEIRRIAPKYFLSINQEAQRPTETGEAQGWVRQMIQAELGERPMYRAPYCMRRGYVEELYQFRPCHHYAPSGQPSLAVPQ